MAKAPLSEGKEVSLSSSLKGVCTLALGQMVLLCVPVPRNWNLINLEVGSWLMTSSNEVITLILEPWQGSFL